MAIYYPYTSYDPMDLTRWTLSNNWKLSNFKPIPEIALLEEMPTIKPDSKKKNFLRVYQIAEDYDRRAINNKFEYGRWRLAVRLDSLSRKRFYLMKKETKRALEQTRFEPDPKSNLYDMVTEFRFVPLITGEQNVYQGDWEFTLKSISRFITV